MLPENKIIYKISIVLLGIIGAALIFFLTNRFGIGLSPDSVYYISVARHIADGSGFTGYDGYSYLLQPPLYPLLLAAIKIIFSADPLISVVYINSFLMGLIIYFSGMYLLKHLKSFPLTLAGTAVILTSFVFIQNFLIALSEPFFILCIILYLRYFDVYTEKGSIKPLILFSIAAALACLTRYVGVIIILSGSISILIRSSKSLKERIRHLVIFDIITIIPIGIWVLRNLIVSGTFAGQRAGSSYTFSKNISLLSNTVLNWFFQIEINGLQLLILIILIAAGILTATALIYLKKKEELKLFQTSPIILFIILYMVIIVVSSTTTAYDKIADRLLSPIFIPLIIMTFILLEFIQKWMSKYSNRSLISGLFLLGIIMWMKYPLMNSFYNIKDYVGQSGWEYSSKEWKDNPVISYLNKEKDLESGYLFYSNVPEAVYILANKAAKWSPARTYYNSPQLVKSDSRHRIMKDSKDKVCLIWFNNSNRSFLFTINELRETINMVKIAQLPNGEIYTLWKK